MKTEKLQNIMLAPMDGYTDLAFRKALVNNAQFNPSLMFTEFVNVEAIIRDIKSIDKILEYEKLTIPTSAQLFGKNPESFRKAIPKVLSLGYRAIDLNFGCGAKKIVQNGEGAGLIGKYEIVEEIIISSASTIAEWEERNGLEPDSIKFSLKTRLGLNSDIAQDWISFLDQFKLDFITIHGRTYSQGYSGRAKWDKIGELNALARTPIIGNGDIMSIVDAQDKILKYNLAGAMIGRNYRKFINDSLKLHDFIGVMKNYLKFHENLISPYFPDSDSAYQSTKKVLLGFIKGCVNAKLLKVKLMKANSYNEANLILMKF